jgi:C-terminal processing protease CtpA/Prc
MFALDYAHQHLYFGPGGISDMSGVVLARDGNRIVVRQVRTHLASRAGVRVGMTLTSVNGRPVSAADLAGVEAALRGQQGNTVNVVFNGNKHVKLVLLNYL